MDNPPFDILLGRAFMERMKGTTDWATGRYVFYVHNLRIEVDAVSGIAPKIVKVPAVTLENHDIDSDMESETDSESEDASERSSEEDMSGASEDEDDP
ncbi:hypothetical protein BGX21_007145, partial [Mortierella sp. AD011]